MIAMNLTYGEVSTFEGALAFAQEQHPFFYTFTYVNAVLFSILNTMVFAGLYELLKSENPLWSGIALAFLPVYAILAIFSYLSQLVIVTRLIDLIGDPELGSASILMLHNMLQMYPKSALGYFDQFSYFILGIPSLIFGLLLYRHQQPLRLAGILLSLSGIACLLIGPGVMLDIPALISSPSMIGGVLSILAFIPLCISLLRGESTPERV